jgi:hypothetical protein
MQENVFIILVPSVPGEAITKPRIQSRNYEKFSGPTLNELKKTVKDMLTSRDVTEFVDVIEYTYSGQTEDRAYEDYTGRSHVAFDFRVARVSTATDKNKTPKLEIPVVVNPAGMIALDTDLEGKPFRPQAHRGLHSKTISYTVERWRRCCAIRDGIVALDKMLYDMFGQDRGEAEQKIDALGTKSLLLAGLNKELES